MRKLASIQKIKAINPIPNADRIECIDILGWHVVSQKNPDRKVGDLVVYFEIDSKMPEVPWFEDLRPYGFRIRTVKMRGQVSQGYAVPLSILEKVDHFGILLKDTVALDGRPDEVISKGGKSWVKIQEGEDVTDWLGITKYEPEIPMCLDGKIKEAFPGWISKTDEERIQANPEILDRYYTNEFNLTEKLDGTSCTVFVDMHDNSFNVCGRKWNFFETEGNALWKAIRNGKVEEGLRKMNGENFYCLQGEVIGPGIQGNKYTLKEFQFHVFNIFNMKTSQHETTKSVQKMCFDFGIKSVPYAGTIHLQHSVDDLVHLVEKRSDLNPKIYCEGLVFRPAEEINDQSIGRLSFKVINPKFLLEYGE